jgi:hypothetical protein
MEEEFFNKDADPKDQAQQGLARRRPPEPGDIYRHHKGDHYVIVCCSVHEDTLQHLVAYRSNRRGTTWTRSLDNFTESVDVGQGGQVPRFSRVVS